MTADAGSTGVASTVVDLVAANSLSLQLSVWKLCRLMTYISMLENMSCTDSAMPGYPSHNGVGLQATYGQRQGRQLDFVPLFPKHRDR
jgi:hypothetical protein